jgi:hypothetical protein
VSHVAVKLVLYKSVKLLRVEVDARLVRAVKQALSQVPKSKECLQRRQRITELSASLREIDRRSASFRGCRCRAAKQRGNNDRCQTLHSGPCSYHFVVAVWRTKAPESQRVKYWAITIAVLPLFSASVALAKDFKTISGRVYKDATISHVEADGIVIKTISKIYFVELPKDVQERFHYGSVTPTAKAATQRIDEAQSPSVPPRPAMPIGLRNKSQQSSTSENRSYTGNRLRRHLGLLGWDSYHCQLATRCRLGSC